MPPYSWDSHGPPAPTQPIIIAIRQTIHSFASSFNTFVSRQRWRPRWCLYCFFSSSRRKLKRKVSYRRLNRHSFSPPAATVALALSFTSSQRQLDWLNWTFVALSMHDMSAEGKKKKRRSWLIPTVCVVRIFQSMALQLCIEMEFWTSFQAPDDLQTSIWECQCTHLEAATLPGT